MGRQEAVPPLALARLCLTSIGHRLKMHFFSMWESLPSCGKDLDKPWDHCDPVLAVSHATNPPISPKKDP